MGKKGSNDKRLHVFSNISAKETTDSSMNPNISLGKKE
jgi:hypothetical protein